MRGRRRSRRGDFKSRNESARNHCRGRLAFAVDDVSAACAELQRRGGRVAQAPVDYQVCQAAEILDPDGNTVILHHRADGTFGCPSKSRLRHKVFAHPTATSNGPVEQRTRKDGSRHYEKRRSSRFC